MSKHRSYRSRSTENDIPSFWEHSSGVKNAFKTLRANIHFSSVDKPVQSLVITSAVPREGKTTVSVSLAVSLAESGKKTLIVDTDCRRPMVGNRLGIRPKKTWLNVLYDECTAVEAAAPTKYENLYILDTEPELTNPVELVGSQKFATMMEDLRSEFDMIIYDTPPLDSFIEAAILAERADGTLLVISSGRVEIKRATEVVEQLKKANANIIGTVLNGVPVAESRYGYYGYYYKNYYYYYYKDGEKTNKSRHERKRKHHPDNADDGDSGSTDTTSTK